VDTKTEQVAPKPKAVDAEPEYIEVKTEHGEDADCVQRVHKAATLCQKAFKQAKHESVYEMKESRQHDEGKQACDVKPAKQCETKFLCRTTKQQCLLEFRSRASSNPRLL
jgi:hypothetical protein